MIPVIGNIFIDIKGISYDVVHKDAKNRGDVEIHRGGVARNVAMNIAVLGGTSRLVASGTQGPILDQVLTELTAVGGDTSFVHPFASHGMGIWLAVLQRDGNLVASISEQPNVAHQETAMLSRIDAYMDGAAAVALDVAVSATVNRHVLVEAKRRDIPVYAVIGNLMGLMGHKEELRGITALVCNIEEASLLVGMKTERRASEVTQVIKALQSLVGCEVVITLGSEGCAHLDSQGQLHVTPALPVDVVDTTGAGDAFFAGYVYGRALGQSQQDSIHMGLDAARQVVSSQENTLPFAFE